MMPNKVCQESDMLVESTLKDAFGKLCIDVEMRCPYDDAAEIILDIRNSVRFSITVVFF